MRVDTLHSLGVVPVVAYPRQAVVGRIYLMTVDLEWDPTVDQWPFEYEEYSIACIVRSPHFSQRPHPHTPEGGVVLHRFGGTYGPAKFLLTARRAGGEATVSIELINAAGISMRTLRLAIPVAAPSAISPRRAEETVPGDLAVAVPDRPATAHGEGFRDVKISIEMVRRQLVVTLDAGEGTKALVGPFGEYGVNPEDTTASHGEIGDRLFQALFADAELRARWFALQRQSPRRRIYLEISSGTPWLHGIEWELMRDPVDGFLAANPATPFSRSLNLPRIETAHRADNHHLLLAIANPQGENGPTLPIVEDNWVSILRTGLARKRTYGLDMSLMSGPVSLRRLAVMLEEGYPILHLTAHGLRVGSEMMLTLADDENRRALISAEELLTAIRAASIPRLVVLDGCETGAEWRGEPLRGFVPKLLQAGVAFVIATPGPLLVGTSLRFASIFYERLLTHGSVDLACNEMRALIGVESTPRGGMPVVYAARSSHQMWGAPDLNGDGGPREGIDVEDTSSSLVGEQMDSQRPLRVALVYNEFLSMPDIRRTFAQARSIEWLTGGDRKELEAADLVIVLPEHENDPELGWRIGIAQSLKKPIRVCFAEEEPRWLMRTLLADLPSFLWQPDATVEELLGPLGGLPL